MDRIFIEGLTLEAVIGVYDWEREVRQILTLDLELGTSIGAAARGDDLSQTLDYKVICDRLADYARDSSFELLEAFAEGVAHLLMTEFGVQGLRLKLGKPGAIPATRTLGVIIERGEAL